MNIRNGPIGIIIAMVVLFAGGIANGQPFDPNPRLQDPPGPDAGRYPGGILEAQKRPPFGEESSRLSPEKRRKQLRKRIELMRMWRLTQELDLDEKTAVQLFSRLRPIDHERWNLTQERRKLQRGLREASEMGKGDEARLRELMKALEKNREAIAALEQKEIQSLDKLLTPRQKAKYLLFREHFERELRERIHEARRPDGPRHRPGPLGGDRPDRLIR